MAREDNKYWIIAVVLGSIVVLIGIIWCILFIYIKACRPPRQHKNQTATFEDNNDLQVKVEPLDRKRPQQMRMTPSKQGVDIVRSEVGLSGQKRGYPEKSNMSSPQKNGRIGTERPKTSAHRQKSPSKEKYRAEAEDSEASSYGTYQSERADDKQLLPPRNTKRATGRGRSASRGKHSSTERPKSGSRSRSRRRSPSPSDDSGRAGRFEPVSKMASSRSSPVKVRSTVHHIKLPPLVQQPLVGERPEDVAREQQEIDEALQQKADIERWRNKQRQRSRRSAKKKSKHPMGDSKDQRRAYMKAQEAIDNVLDTEGHQKHHSHRKSPKRSEDYTSKSGPMPNWGYVDSESELERSQDATLESARQRMHDLLDDAFALIAPLSSNEQEEAAKSQRGHTPMQVAVKPRDGSGSIWNPYTAADEAASIPHQNQSVMPPVGSVATPFLGKLPNTNISSKGGDDYFATQSPEPIVIRTSDLDPYTSATSRTGHRSPERNPVKHDSPRRRKGPSSGGPDPLTHAQRMALSEPSIMRAGGPVEDGTDEQDVIYKSLKPGSSTEPLVKSLRQELERLSQRAGSQQSGSHSHSSHPHV